MKHHLKKIQVQKGGELNFILDFHAIENISLLTEK
jgi:hypothetical protein